MRKNFFIRRCFFKSQQNPKILKFNIISVFRWRLPKVWVMWAPKSCQHQLPLTVAVVEPQPTLFDSIRPIWDLIWWQNLNNSRKRNSEHEKQPKINNYKEKAVNIFIYLTIISMLQFIVFCMIIINLVEKKSFVEHLFRNEFGSKWNFIGIVPCNFAFTISAKSLTTSKLDSNKVHRRIESPTISWSNFSLVAQSRK